MNEFFSKRVMIIYCILLVFLCLPYLFLFTYIHPAGDDFTYAFLGKKSDFLNAWMDEYNLWNGRYFSNFLVLNNPLTYTHIGLIEYRIILFLIYLTLLFSLFYFFKTFLNKVYTFISCLFLVLLFNLLYLTQMPTLAEGMYWYTGVVTYQLGIIFTLLYLSFFYNYINETYLLANKYIHIVSLITFLFAIIGSNEVLMILILVFHSILLIVVYKKNKKLRRVFSLFFTLISLLSLVVYFAPGNKIRETYFIGVSHRFWFSMSFSLLQCVRFVFEWLNNGAIIMLSILFIPINNILTQRVYLFRNNFFLSPWISLFSLFAVIFCCVFPAYWSTGILGQHRTINVAYFFFIILWFVNLSIWINNYPTFFNHIRTKYTFSLTILCFVMLMTTRNNRGAIKDIGSGNCSAFNQELKQRYSCLNRINPNSNKVIYLDTLTAKPVSIFIYDIRNDPNYFPNLGYQRYWHLKGRVYSN
jgi:hypothetical protein